MRSIGNPTLPIGYGSGMPPIGNPMLMALMGQQQEPAVPVDLTTPASPPTAPMAGAGAPPIGAPPWRPSYANLIQSLSGNATDTSPTTRIGAIARALTGGIAGLAGRKQFQNEQEMRAYQNEAMSRALTADDPATRLRYGLLSGHPELAKRPDDYTVNDVRFSGLTNKPLAAAPKPGEGEYTINGQRFAAGGRQIGGPVPQQPLQLKPGEGGYTINGQRFDASGRPLGAQVLQQFAPGTGNRDINGQLVGPNGERLGEPVPRQSIPTDFPAAVREYQTYVAQEQGAGRQPKSFFDYQTALAGATRAATADATLQAQARANLPAAAASRDSAIKVVDDILANPNLGVVTGNWQGTSVGKAITGLFSQGARDLMVKIDQATGKSFMEARQGLKGGGSISDWEGRRAEDAMARMNTAQSEPAFRHALEDFKDAISRGYQAMESESRGQTPAFVGAQAAPANIFDAADAIIGKR